MTILFGIFILYIILNISYVKNGINKEYISRENSRKINGIFVMLVFFSHVSQQIKLSEGWIDNYFSIIISMIGQLMVTTFIFYSGFGIYESIKNKQGNYIDSIPKKRILSTLIKFDIAVIIYAIIGYLIGNKYSMKTILVSLTGWTSVGNSNWYIFSIIFMYLITYVSFKIFKNSKSKGIILNTILVMIFIVVISIFKETWWYDTLFCYPAGMWFSKYKKDIEKYVEKNTNFFKIAILISLIFTISYIKRNNMIVYISTVTISFISLVVLFTMKFKLKDKYNILTFLGNNVFYIYIYQRVPMIIFKQIECVYQNRYIYTILALIITIILTIVINFLCKNTNKIKRCFRKKEE